jgi:hypothetical protein
MAVTDYLECGDCRAVANGERHVEDLGTFLKRADETTEDETQCLA